MLYLHCYNSHFILEHDSDAHFVDRYTDMNSLHLFPQEMYFQKTATKLTDFKILLYYSLVHLLFFFTLKRFHSFKSITSQIAKTVLHHMAENIKVQSNKTRETKNTSLVGYICPSKNLLSLVNSHLNTGFMMRYSLIK